MKDVSPTKVFTMLDTNSWQKLILRYQKNKFIHFATYFLLSQFLNFLIISKINRGGSDHGKKAEVYKLEKRKEIELEEYIIHGYSGDRWRAATRYSNFQIPYTVLLKAYMEIMQQYILNIHQINKFPTKTPNSSCIIYSCERRKK